jgi:predicted ABC-type ATPase
MLAFQTADFYSTGNPVAIILGGQQGCGKTDLMDIALTELQFNAIFCNVDNLREYHPYANTIKSNHEDKYTDLTADFAKDLNKTLRSYCESHRLNFILETTFSSGPEMNHTIQKLKNIGYRVELKVLAVHPKISLLSTRKRFEEMFAKEGTGRMVTKMDHDDRFGKLIPTLESVDSKKLYDKIEIYGRNNVIGIDGLMTGVRSLGVNPNNIVSVYLKEMHAKWTDDMLKFYQQDKENVIQMMQARNADNSFIQQFKDEMNMEYTLPKQSNLLDKTIKPASGLLEKRVRRNRGKGPKL